MRPRAFPLLAAALSAAALGVAPRAAAQSLERRILGVGDGEVELTFAARPGVCGDGATFVEDGLGGHSRVYEGGNFSGRRRDDYGPPCESGPVRLVAWVADGQVVRLRTYVGPTPPPRREGTRRLLGDVPVREAVGVLTALAERGSSRVAEQALLPLVIADTVPPWPTLLRIARDEQVGRSVRRSAAFWLSRGAAAKVGVADADPDDDDDVRVSAVFALSQQPRAVAVPQLLELARTSKRPPVRAQALFWLGQSGDSRAIDLFAELLAAR